MAESQLPRRDLLRLALGAGALAAVGPLSGCSGDGPRLVSARGTLPSAWARALPRPWRLVQVETPEKVLAAAPAALLQLSDGWTARLPATAVRPFGSGSLFEPLDPAAAPVSRLYRSAGSPALAFPWCSTPWLLLLRSRPDLLARRAEGWDLLLDPSLRGRVVLPSSPRVVMALMGGEENRLRRLRRQVLAHDDRNGVNLLLSGEAEAAVLPRTVVIPLLRRDPRLAALLPDQGSPLSWSLLLRPAGATADPPPAWLESLFEPPLLRQLLIGGWVPPLSPPLLGEAVRGFPPVLAALLLPPAAVRARCRDLPPLAAAERKRLQALWDATAPAGDP